ncbi:MAG: hypothetical protein HC888_03065 [Candidatus Competibacteraceae bacterium]|nr:hypothetical protein [Candidatus Competibacteraceae bacterium]
MIDACNITDFNRSDADLQEFILFCCAVAGKTANQIEISLERFLTMHNPNKLPIIISAKTQQSSWTPFEYIEALKLNGLLWKSVVDSKLGQHSKLCRLFESLATSGIDLRTCWVDDLEWFKGIGPKTSRYFLLHSRPPGKLKHPIACIDTHQLKYLRSVGFDAPKSLNKSSYPRWEKVYLNHSKDIGITNIAEFDLSVWNSYSRK